MGAEAENIRARVVCAYRTSCAAKVWLPGAMFKHFAMRFLRFAILSFLPTTFISTYPSAAQDTVSVTTDSRLAALADIYAPIEDQSLSLRLNSPEGHYVNGDSFAVKVTAAAANLFLYLDYYQLDGYVVHIVPSLAMPENQIGRDQTLSIGADPDATQYTVQPPFGREVIVVVASTVPLYKGFRREFEQAGGYLDFLDTALQGIVAGGGRVTVRLQAIHTSDAPPAAAEIPVASQPERSETQSPLDVAADEAVEPEQAIEVATDAASEDLAAEDALPKLGANNAASLQGQSEIDVGGNASDDPASEPAPQSALNSAAEPAVTATEAEREDPALAARERLRDHYKSEVLPKLQRVISDPTDEENLTALSKSYADYVIELARWGHFAEARKKLQVAQVMNPASVALEAASVRIARVLRAHENYLRGLQFFDKGDLLASHQAFVAALEMEPGYPLAEAKLAAIAGTLVVFFEKQAERAADGQDIEISLDYWKRVSSLAPEDAEARAEIERLTRLLGTN